LQVIGAFTLVISVDFEQLIFMGLWGVVRDRVCLEERTGSFTKRPKLSPLGWLNLCHTRPRTILSEETAILRDASIHPLNSLPAEVHQDIGG
jgi:hypothetical protein